METLKYLLILLIFYPSLTFSMSDALEKTKEAMIIQFKLDKYVDSSSQYIQKQLKIQKEVYMVGYLFKMYKDKRIFFRLTNKDLSFSRNSVSITYYF